ARREVALAGDALGGFEAFAPGDEELVFEAAEGAIIGRRPEGDRDAIALRRATARPNGRRADFVDHRRDGRLLIEGGSGREAELEVGEDAGRNGAVPGRRLE